MNKPKGLSMNLIIIIILAILITAGGFAWWLVSGTTNDTNQNTNSITSTVNTNISRINDNANINYVSAININTTPGTNSAIDIVNTNISRINANTNTASDPTDGWLTYTNDWYDYQQMYPPDWIVEEVDISAEDSVGGWPNRYVKFIAPGGEYRTYFGVRLVGEEVSAFWRTGIGAGDITSEGTTMIGDTSVPITYITYDGIVQDIFYQGTGLGSNIINGHDIYAQYAGPDNVAGLEDTEEFETSKTILSTFIWLDIVEAEVSSTYTNSDCGYSITLPIGWYAHVQTSNSTLFLMEATLPSVGATEGFAYGTQFSIRCGDIMTDAGASNETEFLEAMIDEFDTFDNPIVQTSVIRNGLNMTRYTMASAGAEGTILGYYYVNGTTYFELSHWPYNELSAETQDFENVVNSFSQI